MSPRPNLPPRLKWGGRALDVAVLALGLAFASAFFDATRLLLAAIVLCAASFFAAALILREPR